MEIMGRRDGLGRDESKPAPFKKTKGCGTQKPRRIWKWGVMQRNLELGFARGFLRGEYSMRDGGEIVRTRVVGTQIADGAGFIFFKKFFGIGLSASGSG
jgi:hypothetical protein